MNVFEIVTIGSLFQGTGLEDCDITINDRVSTKIVTCYGAAVSIKKNTLSSRGYWRTEDGEEVFVADHNGGSQSIFVDSVTFGVAFPNSISFEKTIKVPRVTFGGSEGKVSKVGLRHLSKFKHKVAEEQWKLWFDDVKELVEEIRAVHKLRVDDIHWRYEKKRRL